MAVWIEKRAVGILLIGWVVCASIWHAFGPISGVYSFDVALNIFAREMAEPWAWEIVLFTAIIAVVITPGRIGYWVTALESVSRSDACRSLVWAVFCVVVVGAPRSFLSTFSLMLCVALWGLFTPYPRLLRQFASGVVGYLVVGYAFTMYKSAIFWDRMSWDNELIAADRWLFGNLPHRMFAAWAQASPELLALVDSAYLKLFAIMVAILAYCVVAEGRELAERYLRGLSVLYLLGAVSYFALPAWGPFQSDFGAFPPEIWDPKLWRVANIQAFILENSQRMAMGRGDMGTIYPFAFVAAMPSLHIAVPALGFWLLRPRPQSMLITIPFCVATAIAALATGMHYGVDLLAGIVLAWVAVRVEKATRK